MVGHKDRQQLRVRSMHLGHSQVEALLHHSDVMLVQSSLDHSLDTDLRGDPRLRVAPAQGADALVGLVVDGETAVVWKDAQ
jgi:hypothetical protein